MARWYYYPGSETNVLERVRNRLLRKPVPNFPRTVVIETQFGCNAGCVFCHYSQVKDKLPRGRMSAELFDKIAAECHAQAVERFILCLDNEPLMDPVLAQRYEALRRHCPGAHRNLTTNASLLTPEKIEQLLGSGLVDELFLSINGESKEVYEQSMKLPYEKVFKNLEYLCQWLRAHPQVRAGLRVRVNTVKTKMVAPELPALRRRWAGEGFEVHVITLDNRGAQLDLKNLATAPVRPFVTCRRPFHTLVITWEGRAVLCCADYQREVELGNLNDMTVSAVWNGPWATQLRKEFLAQDFSHLRICAACRVSS